MTRLAVTLCVLLAALLGALTSPPRSGGAPAVSPAPPAPSIEATTTPQPAPTPKTTARQTPVPIPVPDIVGKAEEVTKLLRQLERLTEPVPAIVAIQARLPELSARLGPELTSTIEILEQGPPIGIQERLTQSWQASRSELAEWQEVVTKRATQLERDLERLATLRGVWARTRTAAQASRAPTPVVQNVDAVLADIEATHVRLQAQRALALVLQDQIARAAQRCEEALAQIAQFQHGIVALMLTRTSPAIWSRQLRREDVQGIGSHINDELGAAAGLVLQFAAQHPIRMFLHGLLFLGLLLGARGSRSWARRFPPGGESRQGSAVVFDRPYSAACVAALVSVFWIYPGRPRTIGDVAGILLLLPLFRIVQPLMMRAMTPALYVFSALILVDRIRAQLVVTTLADQVLLMLEMSIAIVVLAWLLGSPRVRGGLMAAGVTPGRLRAQDGLVTFCLVVCAASLAVAAYGAVRLARWLGSGLLVDVYLVIAAYGAVTVMRALQSVAFSVWPLCRLGMVKRHRALLERRGHRLFGWIMAGTVALAILSHRGLLDRVAQVGGAVLAAELRRGGLGISVGDVLAFLLTVGLAFALSSFVRFLLTEDVFPRLHLAHGLAYTISSLLHYTILLVGFLLAVAALGLDVTKVTILAGAFGVGLGLGLQGVVNNFVSGLIVLLERPMRVGDAIQMGEVAGQVRRIGIRSTTVHTWEGASVIVPNASLVAEKVTNWTVDDRQRRIDVRVSVAYGSPPEKVLELLRGVAAAHPSVLTHPAPEAFFLEFGENALQFELRAWTARLDQAFTIKSDLNIAVYATLQDAGLEIPLPQREVRWRPA